MVRARRLARKVEVAVRGRLEDVDEERAELARPEVRERAHGVRAVVPVEGVVVECVLFELGDGSSVYDREIFVDLVEDLLGWRTGAV